MLTPLIRSRYLLMLMTAVLSVSLIAAACGGDDDDDDTGDPTTAPTEPAGETPDGEPTEPGEEPGGEFDYGSLDGTILIDGSSTVYPVSEAVAFEFASVADTRVEVALSGTGGGFERFCRGEIQIADASRPIEQDEIDACAEAGIDDIVELQVGIDALSVVVNPANDFATCMTVEQLHQVFKADGATRWNEVDPSWPDEEITWFYPGTDSGTFDYFVEAIIEGIDENANHTAAGTPSEDDNVLAIGVEEDEFAIGYFGFAYFQSAGDSLNAVSIDNGDGCVEPSFETALDGSYEPLSRPLFIYTRESLLAEDPDVLGFINFYYEILDDIVPEVGYVSLPEDTKAEQTAKFEEYLP